MSPEAIAIYANTNAEIARVLAMQAANVECMMRALANMNGSQPLKMPYNENCFWAAAANLDSLACEAKNTL